MKSNVNQEVMHYYGLLYDKFILDFKVEELKAVAVDMALHNAQQEALGSRSLLANDEIKTYIEEAQLQCDLEEFTNSYIGQLFNKRSDQKKVLEILYNLYPEEIVKKLNDFGIKHYYIVKNPKNDEELIVTNYPNEYPESMVSDKIIQDQKVIVHATFKDGNIYDLSTNEIVANTSEKVIYVADPLGNINFQPEINKPLVFHHHEILLVDEFPASVSSAGHLTIRDGKITYISNKSGHYHPTKDQFKAFLYKAYNAGILAEDITIRIYNSLYSYQDVEIDFESLNINKILEACVELPNSNYIDYYDHVDFAGEIDLETFDF